MQHFTTVCGGVTAARGFRASGVPAGIKPGRPDLALLVADSPCPASGVFTTNRVVAAPVRLDRERLTNGLAQAVVINSGNANACTGEQGMADARQMAVLTAAGLGLDPSLVLVCSTGVIGVPLAMDKIAKGIPLAVASLADDGGGNAARAIMTTDREEKQHAVAFDLDRTRITVGGMAKGAGMIDPRMATMLGFITTDAMVGTTALRQLLGEVVDETFNRISVDGDCSTNDTVLMMANGRSGSGEITPDHAGWSLLREALRRVCRHLAQAIVMDGEGATKLVSLRITRAATMVEAENAARAVANSPLVKTSWFGADPNWGRIMAALGYSGARFKEEDVAIYYNGIPAFRDGRGAGSDTIHRLEEVLRLPRFELVIDLAAGDCAFDFYTCDLTLDYVKINSDYTT